MSNLQRTRQPGRWIRNCENAAVDPCDNLSQADWKMQKWIFVEGGLSAICVEPSVGSNISQITIFPDGGVYNGGGTKVLDLVYNPTTGKYERVGLAKVTPNGSWYALIPALTVITNDGTTCSLDFLQNYSGDPIVIVPNLKELTIIHTNSGIFNLTVDNSVGTVDWGDGTSDPYDASATPQTLSNTYSGAGPWTVTLDNGFDSSEFIGDNEDITNVDLSQATEWTSIEFQDNTNCTGVTFSSSHNQTITLIDFSNCDLTGQINLQGLTTLGGIVNFGGNANLTGILNPTSANTITQLLYNDCNLLGTQILTGLTLSGVIDFNQNGNMTGVLFGTQTGVITNLDLNRCDITGTLDLSGFSNLGGIIRLYQNNNMTAISNPTTSQTITEYRIDNCDITGTLNISGFSNLSGKFQCNGNNNLTAISNPTSSGVFNQYNCVLCDITGTLDLSGLTGLGGIFSCRSNSNLTGITNPTSSETFDQYICYACDITGTLDLSGLTGLGGLLQLRNNSNMTGITFPTSAVTTTQLQMNACDLGYCDITGMTFDAAIDFDMSNNNMVVAEVNHMSVDMDNTFPGTGTGTINIAGTNAAPDGSSGGYDGTTAKANLISKGYTVITS